MKEKISGVFRRTAFYLYYHYASVSIPIRYRKSNKNGELSYLSQEDLDIWANAMVSMLKEYCIYGYNSRVRQIITTFSDSKIKVIRKTEPPASDRPIVVLCVKNDLQRLQMLVEHYRALGIVRFAFMDNGSDDGTYEWCLDQEDIDLYQCLEPYQTLVKEGWINRIVSHYGFNRWYILTDSDELMVYKGMEEHPIDDLVKYGEKHGIKRFKGLTLDTYSESNLFGKTDDIKKSYRWIDIDSYKAVETQRGDAIVKRLIGGPRYRLMGSRITLSKFPLVYFEPGTFSDSAHYQFPHDCIDSTPCNLGILHYKFIDKDLDVYKERAGQNTGFSGGGKFYKQYLDYLDHNEEATFMYEGSREFTSSEVLSQIELIESLEFDQ